MRHHQHDPKTATDPNSTIIPKKSLNLHLKGKGYLWLTSEQATPEQIASARLLKTGKSSTLTMPPRFWHPAKKCIKTMQFSFILLNDKRVQGGAEIHQFDQYFKKSLLHLYFDSELSTEERDLAKEFMIGFCAWNLATDLIRVIRFPEVSPDGSTRPTTLTLAQNENDSGFHLKPFEFQNIEAESWRQSKKGKSIEINLIHIGCLNKN